MKNTVFREVYVVGATLFEGVKSIEGSDWTDTVSSACHSDNIRLRVKCVCLFAVLFYSEYTTSYIYSHLDPCDLTGCPYWQELRADQRKYLCSLDSARGTNPTTGADTRESMFCD